MSALPIDQIIPELLQAVAGHGSLIVHAPPGAGKTTRIPLALLEAIPPAAGRIVMLEPRRLAAVSAARWMAACLGEEAGRTVGYTIRFESRVSPDTRIEVVTEGVLTRRIQADPLLEGVAVVIFDEFHERSLQADLGLALCREVQQQVRPDLKLLVMSATLDIEPLRRLLDDAPLISSAGRSFPVAERYLDDPGGRNLIDRMVRTVLQALEAEAGDLLVFLPGSGEIRACAERLTDAGLAGRGIALHPLYGDLPFEAQQAAIRPGPGRKVVLATSIAETSLTIEGVRVVIDSGLSRRVRFDAASGLDRLVTVRESRASAEQRRGRAGRVAPGVCYRLFSQHTFQAMTPHTPPEIREADLAPLILELAAWGEPDPLRLCWLDPPNPAALDQGRALLVQLGALEPGGALTPTGRRMAALPLHPRLAALLLRGEAVGEGGMACDLAALLSERDIVRRLPGAPAVIASDSDLADRLECLEAHRTGRSLPLPADRGALRQAERVARHLRRLLRTGDNNNGHDRETVGRLLLAAYPDRLARRREGGEGGYLLAGGRGARLSPHCAVRTAEWLVAVSLDGGAAGEAMIQLASTLDERLIREELGGRIRREEETFWSEAEERIVARQWEGIGALTLVSRPCQASAAAAVPALLEALRASRLALLDLGEPLRQLQGRVRLLRDACPEAGWPDLSDEALLEALDEWLAPWLDRVRNRQQLHALDIAAILRNGLEYRLQRDLDAQAPTSLVVPSGSRIRIDYGGDAPVLAVKLQELFGLAATPTVADGRVPLVLHLLSPAGRPLQVTRDLRGFWDGAYHEVKKEMKGRYPKHPWPDDPWSAVPTRRTKPRP